MPGGPYGNLKAKQEKIRQAAEAFAKGMPKEEAEKTFGVCYASIYRAIKKYKIPFTYTFGRKVFWNEKYFDTINTDEKAYWLGFLYPR